MTAANAAPPSGQPSSAGTRCRWAVDEMGRNSVTPWTRPSTAACRVVKVRELYLGFFALPPIHLPRVPGDGLAGGRAQQQRSVGVDADGGALDASPVTFDEDGCPQRRLAAPRG